MIRSPGIWSNRYSNHLATRHLREGVDNSHHYRVAHIDRRDNKVDLQSSLSSLSSSQIRIAKHFISTFVFHFYLLFLPFDNFTKPHPRSHSSQTRDWNSQGTAPWLQRCDNQSLPPDWILWTCPRADPNSPARSCQCQSRSTCFNGSNQGSQLWFLGR